MGRREVGSSRCPKNNDTPPSRSNACDRHRAALLYASQRTHRSSGARETTATTAVRKTATNRDKIAEPCSATLPTFMLAGHAGGAVAGAGGSGQGVPQGKALRDEGRSGTDDCNRCCLSLKMRTKYKCLYEVAHKAVWCSTLPAHARSR